MAHADNDLKKGSVEPDTPEQHSQTSMRGQIAHRPEDSRVDGDDSDFPEPGESPEHSGQHGIAVQAK